MRYFLFFFYFLCSFSFADSIYTYKDESLKGKSRFLESAKITYFSDPDISLYKTFWLINCSKKEFDNIKICSLRGDDLIVYLIDGKYSLRVGLNHYPRTRAGFRVDNGKSIYGYEGDFSNSSALLNQLKKGKFVYTRYQKWPYLSNIDKKTDLDGFNENFKEMLHKYKEL